MHPWPSNFHRRAGESGAVVRLSGEGVPLTTDGQRVDLVSALNQDGFSTLPMITAMIPSEIDVSVLVPPLSDLSPTLSPTSRTLLIDADSGELIAHASEVDPRPADPLARALTILPAHPLLPGRRYVVAVQGLTDLSGAAIEPSATFAALRQGLASSDGAIAKSQAAYYRAHILPVLDQLGVKRDGLQLAWDFTTATGLKTRLKAMAQSAVQACRSGAETCGALSDVSWQEDSADDVAYRATGEVRLPGFVDSETYPSRHLSVEASAGFDVPFTVSVSAAAAKRLKAGQAAPVVIMGHGFFGQRGEVDGDAYRAIAQEAGAVAVAIDWWGLATPDVGPIVTNILSDVSDIVLLRDRLEQGIVHVVSLASLAGVEGGEASLSSLTLPGTTARVFHPAASISYFGCSLGHILGGTAAAVSPDIQRAALMVGGAGFAQIFTRSFPFGSLLTMLDGRFDSRADSLLSLAQLAEVLATVDPVTWAEEARSKRNLIQVGVADTSVPLLAARLHARALGATWLAPGDVPVWGLTPSKAPAAAYVEVDFGDENPAPTATPPTVETPVHEATRRVPAVIEQVGLFLKTGELKHTCDGPCDPD